MTDISVTIAENAPKALLQFCTGQGLANFMLLADGNAAPPGLCPGDAKVSQTPTRSHFLRNRFTICKLKHLFGLPDIF
jgi:hypothetical protein